MAPDGSTTMSSRLSCWVNSDRSGIHHHHCHHHHNHHHNHRRRRRSNRKWRHLALRHFRVFDRRWKGTPPPGTFCHLRPDGRTHGRTEACLRRTKRQRDRKRDEERESEIQSLCLFLSLSFSLAFSPSLFYSVFSVLFLFFFFFFSTFHINFSWNDDIYFSCLERPRLKNRNECKTRSRALTRLSLCYAINRWKRPIQEEQKNMLTYMMCICCVDFFYILMRSAS